MPETLITQTTPFTATAVEPIHHGAGTSGNTSLLRTQEIVGVEGFAAVPFVSGNSLRHTLRAAAADHLLAVCEVEPRSLSKAAVDLLYSGGALTKPGANTDLETPRLVELLVPSLTLFGYSAGSSMQAGKLRVDNIHLVCRENGWRLPHSLTESPNAKLRAASFRGEEFGTRHDAGRSPSGRHYRSLLEAVESKTTQMIYDFQVVKPGATFFGALQVVNATSREVAALQTAIACASSEEGGSTFVWLGAKRAVGYGKVAVDLQGSVSSEYNDSLRENREQIVELIEDLVA